MRLKEVAELPHKKQSLPRRHQDAWRLAMRLRKDQAVERNDPGHSAMAADTWPNIVDFLTFALNEGDFATLDQFADAWLKLRAKVQPVARGENGLLQALAPSNPPGAEIRIAVIQAIRVFQAREKRRPTRQELLTECQHVKEGGLDDATLSKTLDALGLREVV
ncbi:MAG TPA: hypothetical protein VIM57_01185 [Luteolibacter sp.]